MTREDLEELHALAASISDQTHGWRAHRRQRASEIAARRAEADQLAPVRRRRRHRQIAAAGVALVAASGAVFAITHRPDKPAPAPTRTIVTVHHLPREVRIGQGAAAQLDRQGRVPDVFACEGLYEAQRMGSVPGQQGPAWRAGYLKACAGSSPATGTGG